MDFMTFKKGSVTEAIKALINERNQCRDNKDFPRADAIRNQLLEMGIKIYDTKEGTKYRAIKT